MGGTTKTDGGGGGQILKSQWGGTKGGITIFDLNLVGGKPLEETMQRYSFIQMFLKNKQNL